MITSETFRGKRYAVLGLARSGLATVEALLESGASVVAWDSDEKKLEATLGAIRVNSVAELARSEGIPITFEFADPLTLDLSGYDAVIVSPGVPLNRHPIAAHAREAGVPIIGDIELFALARPSLPPHKVVGITGTNGKSTTTALVHHILKTAGVPTTMGGNIGLPILAQEPLAPNENGVGVYVLELSSYQIDLTRSLDCDVAVLLNVTPDHLDRYESFEAYAASKVRLFELQSSEHVAVLTDDPSLSQFRQWNLNPDGIIPNPMRQTLIEGNSEFPEPWGAAVVGDAEWEGHEFSHQNDWPNLRGPHNAQNAAAAIAVCVGGLGLEPEAVADGLRTYPGLAHRMERVAEKDGILFVNDSKATNPDSTAPALAAYRDVHWIVGGRAKTQDLGPCEAQLNHVRAAYTIGEAGPMFARLLEGRVPVRQSGVLDIAVRDAAGAAKAGEVVLLSPACASFDQFRDYEQRGQAFRDAVEALA